MRTAHFLCAIAATAAMALTAQAADHDNHGHTINEVTGEITCFPKNDQLRPEVDGKGVNGMTKEVYDAVLDRIDRVYQPEFGARDLRLKIKRKWRNNTVNAMARPEFFNRRNRLIFMYGGLARHETITPDGFALVACHEIGHHIGGFPKTTRAAWASNEGQSDYFATLKCLRKYFAEDNNVEIVSQMSGVPSLINEKCAAAFNTDEEIAICIRGTIAGQSVSNLFQNLSRGETPASVNTPDPNVVTRTSHSHPAFQCRLDTYFAGAVCPVDDNTSVSESDPDQGTCSRRMGDQEGLRPLCWFAPANNFNLAVR